MSHTPGPWEWCGEHAPYAVFIGGTKISDCKYTGKSVSEAIDNAKLIAAAPELLAALVKVWQEGVIPDGFAILQDQVCDAIAKAIGEQP